MCRPNISCALVALQQVLWLKEEQKGRLAGRALGGSDPNRMPCTGPHATEEALDSPAGELPEPLLPLLPELKHCTGRGWGREGGVEYNGWPSRSYALRRTAGPVAPLPPPWLVN